jgi:hypothetical protein
MSTDREFADFLRALHRDFAPEQVEQIEQERDAERGPYVPHGGEVHHSSEESRH